MSRQERRGVFARPDLVGGANRNGVPGKNHNDTTSTTGKAIRRFSVVSVVPSW
jgi:hypothetical protein